MQGWDSRELKPFLVTVSWSLTDVVTYFCCDTEAVNVNESE